MGFGVQSTCISGLDFLGWACGVQAGCFGCFWAFTSGDGLA